MFVDIYTHILPPAVAAAIEQLGSGLGIAKRMKAVRDVHDLDSRFRSMDAIADYRQIVSLPNPPLEAFTTASQVIDLARVANDGMAELVRKYPERFPGFVAALPMHEVEPSVAEGKRAMTELGAKGIQLFTNVNGKPIDAKEYEPLFALAEEHDLPIWLHPTRSAEFPDYRGEKFSRYEMWWCFGWPYETSVAMARLVLTGIFDRFPKIKIITHHGGGMIPFYDKRIEHGLACLGGRTQGRGFQRRLAGLKAPLHGLFPRFLRRHRALRQFARPRLRAQILRRRSHGVRLGRALRADQAPHRRDRCPRLRPDDARSDHPHQRRATDEHEIR